MTTADLVQGDKGYDTNAMRWRIEAKGTAPKIPPQRQPPLEKLLLTLPVLQPQRHRAHVQPAEGVSPHRDPIRSPRASGEKFEFWGFSFGVNSDSVGEEMFHGKSCFE